MDTMSAVTQSIVVGVVSGVLTSIGIAVFLLFVKKVFIPWYQSITYSGINLSGTWYAVDPTMAQRIEITLKQTAKHIKGHAVFTHIPDEEDDDNPFSYEPTRTFNLTGLTQDRFVALTLRHTDINRLGINCYLLEVIGDGRRMSGHFSFYSINTNQIGESYHLLYRDRSEANRVSIEARRDLKGRRKELLEELKENERQMEASGPDEQAEE
ncbi:hypothetical protein [Xanthomonas arboricola]|uniref:hypothetical protein n=1 Tax=Xanthomonas arboricola TaxID=56448 RepID=UPI00141AC8FD|nr:hypothetical protein [Xanthomonas arboricola]NIK51929.1 hypothetical protein [Xanthomonas arboricola]